MKSPLHKQNQNETLKPSLKKLCELGGEDREFTKITPAKLMVPIFVAFITIQKMEKSFGLEERLQLN